MKNLFIKNPNLYLLLFCLLALVAGIESGDIIKNRLPEKKGASYLTIFGIAINFILAFFFLFTYIKIRNKEQK